ncbi:hypothetical protein CK203_017840 [Vitis vinifera]|uniref:Uncharacterized protein n=1 Tax=Vitis vinifera TaxID=29760 RepID=A0A438JHB0_VITVI|nr:hypothetical protein CK203_017840 [Vitis vinifera]
MVETSQDWSRKLPFALWPYRTSFSHSYRSYTLLLGVWYGGCFANRDRDGFFKSGLEQQISEAEWASSI